MEVVVDSEVKEEDVDIENGRSDPIRRRVMAMVAEDVRNCRTAMVGVGVGGGGDAAVAAAAAVWLLGFGCCLIIVGFFMVDLFSVASSSGEEV